jgi:hypothetical protein
VGGGIEPAIARSGLGAQAEERQALFEPAFRGGQKRWRASPQRGQNKSKHVARGDGGEFHRIRLLRIEGDLHNQAPFFAFRL